MVRLVPFERIVFGDVRHITLQMDSTSGARHLWGTFDGLKFERDYDGQAWVLSESDRILPERDFVPGIVELERVEPLVEVKVWRTAPPVHLRLPAPPRAVAPLARRCRPCPSTSGPPKERATAGRTNRCQIPW